MNKQQSNRRNQNNVKSIIDRIFEDNSYKHDQFLRMKNNLLILIFLGTIYGLHYLFKEYLDTIILAVLSGIAYQQISLKFVNFWKQESLKEGQQLKNEKKSSENQVEITDKLSSQYNQQKMKNFNIKIIVQTIICVFLLFLLPWVRHLSSKVFKYDKFDFDIDMVWRSFLKTRNIIIRILQAYLLIKIIYNIMGNKLKKCILIKEMTDRKESIFRGFFLIITIIACISLIVIVPTILVSEGSTLIFISTNTIEKFFDCRLYNRTQLNKEAAEKPLCTNKIPIGYIANFIVFNQTKITQCQIFLNKKQLEFIGYDIFSYEEYLCRFKQLVSQISPSFLQSAQIVETGQKLISIIFGKLAAFLTTISNCIFSVTTYFTIFLITVKYFSLESNLILRILGDGKDPLINQVSELIEVTILVTVQHFLLSIVLFQIFQFSEINFLLSLLLSVCAFIPIFKPFFFVVIFTAIKSLFTGCYFATFLLLICYYQGSKIIYQHYQSINFHHVIINLSILLGIYQFGVTGIFYGPILIMFFVTVSKELLSPQAKQKPVS